MERSNSAPRRLIHFPILGSSAHSSSSSLDQNANMLTHQEGELPGTHSVVMGGPKSDPPTLIDFMPLLRSGPHSSSSSLIQNHNTVTTGLPRQGLRRKRSSSVSTELVLHDQWKIKKTLKQSDIGQSRLLLPLECVEDYLFQLMPKKMVSEVKSKKEIQVGVRDTDTKREHELKFGYWESSGGYVLKHGWTKLFVEKRRLKVGDSIGMCWHNNKFHFTVLRRATSNPAA